MNVGYMELYGTVQTNKLYKKAIHEWYEAVILCKTVIGYMDMWRMYDYMLCRGLYRLLWATWAI
jgi:hypothetical protein